ncbi:hypothetical protein V1477_005755 [Vespula maculifrons]|uniref:Uncharacterized protein n=1 Tax=Vespula maculifrons TaxID=7453 RepID=A0ABD2CLX4_VESMC
MIKASYTIKVFIVLRDNSVSPDTLLNYALICSVRLSQRVIVIPRSVWFNVPNYLSEYSRHVHKNNV